MVAERRCLWTFQVRSGKTHDRVARTSTVEEGPPLTRRPQQYDVAAHEARTMMLTERIDEMRDQLDQAGLNLQAAESQI